MRRTSLLFWVGFIWCVSGYGQDRDSLFTVSDSVQVFTIDQFYEILTRNHPVARQAQLLSELARQEVRLARGSFDPKLEASWNRKNFKDTEYYNLFNAEIKFPLRIPVDPKVGMYRNTGKYLNPEEIIPEADNFRQYYAGVSLPIGRGLITDERRTQLRQAELFRGITEAEQIKLLNKLMLEAAKDYWSWFYSYYNFLIQSRGVDVARELFVRAKLNMELGELAPVDTLQAGITYQQREVEKQEAFLEFQNATLKLSTYLWDSVGPLKLEPNWIPVQDGDQPLLLSTEVDELKSRAMERHPELQKIRLKREQVEADRRLAAEFLKPRLDINYTLINQPFGPSGFGFNGIGKDNKIGLDFSVPLFLRKERAKLVQSRVKIEQLTFDVQNTERQIRNDIESAYNTMLTNTALIQRLRQMVDYYERIFQAEILNLENGESDLFKVNIQMEKLLSSRSKLLKLLAEYEKNKAMLYWSAGVRNLGRVD